MEYLKCEECGCMFEENYFNENTNDKILCPFCDIINEEVGELLLLCNECKEEFSLDDLYVHPTESNKFICNDCDLVRKIMYQASFKR